MSNVNAHLAAAIKERNDLRSQLEQVTERLEQSFTQTEYMKEELQQQLEAEQAGAAMLREALPALIRQYADNTCRIMQYDSVDYHLKLLYEEQQAVWTNIEQALSTPAGAAMLERLRKAEESLNWLLNNLAIRDCEHDAEGSDETTPCTETGVCITEYCLPCYARVIKKEAVKP